MAFAWYLERWRSGLSAWNGMEGVWGILFSEDDQEKDLDLHSSETEIPKWREGSCGFGNLDLASES
jgi:hypothetical protein